MSKYMNLRSKTQSEGLALVRYINLAMGDDVTVLIGDGVKHPFRIRQILEADCGMMKGMVEWFNITSQLRYANERKDS